MQMTHFTFHSVRATLKNGRERIMSSYLVSYKNGMKIQEIHDDMLKTLDEDSPCLPAILP